jgi:hypothetical protein
MADTKVRPIHFVSFAQSPGGDEILMVHRSGSVENGCNLDEDKLHSV